MGLFLSFNYRDFIRRQAVNALGLQIIFSPGIYAVGYSCPFYRLAGLRKTAGVEGPRFASALAFLCFNVNVPIFPYPRLQLP